MSTNKLFNHPGTFVTGVNYWASHAATEMWSKWDEKVIRKDLKVLADNGTQMIRVFPLWPDFQPITRLFVGDGRAFEYRFGEDELPDTEAGRAGVSELMMERFEKFCDIAAQNNIQIIAALITGQMTYRLYMPPGLAGLNPISDPEALMWEQRFVRYFVRRMKSHKAICAWDFGNECNYMGKAPSAATVSVWMNSITDVIKREDPERPLISGMDGTALENTIDHPENPGHSYWSASSQAECCNILTTHHYMMWKSAGSDPCDTIKPGLFPVAEAKMYGDITNKPCFIEEIGMWRPMIADFETAGRYLRMLYWNLWANSNGGLLWWCAFDQDNQGIAPYDWESPGVEHGMFGHDFKIRNTGSEMKKFRTFLDKLPFKSIPRSEADAICILGDQRQKSGNIAASTFILANEAGINLEFAHARKAIPEAKFYMLPSAYGKAGLSSKNWEILKKRVHNGASLYISIDDCYLQGLTELSGAEVRTRAEKGGETTYQFVIEKEKISVKLPSPILRTMKVNKAEIIGSDDNGNPVFFESKYGKGRVYYLSIPLEKLMMDKPSAFLNKESSDAWKIYSSMFKRELSEKIVTKNNPLLSVSEHKISEKEMICIVCNNSPVEVNESLQLKSGWKLESAFSSDKSTAKTKHGLQLHIEANSGLCLQFSSQTT